MTTSDLLKAKRNDILRLAAPHGAHNGRVFESVARGEAYPTSDIDLLVKLDHGRSLLDLIDPVRSWNPFFIARWTFSLMKGLSPYLEQRIHAEAVPPMKDDSCVTQEYRFSLPSNHPYDL